MSVLELTTPVSTAPAVSTEYRPAVDGVRAIAVLAVFVFHLNRAWLPGGFVGVDIFFVISGFLITSLLLRDIDQGCFSFLRFYQRRIARLLPAFATVAAATTIGACVIYSDQDFASVGATLSAAALSVANVKFMMQGNYFVLSPDAQPFLHCWSLSIEEQFYLVFPAALLIISLVCRRRCAQILAALCAVSLFACIYLTRSHPQWAFFLLPTRGWELLTGGLVAACGNSIKVGPRWKSAGLILLILSFLVIRDSAAFPGYLAAVPVLGTAFLIGPATTSEGIEQFLSWSPAVLIGRMSYSLYLWHWPVFSFIDYRLYLSSPLTRFVLKLGISFAAAALCFFFIERPGRAVLNRASNGRAAFVALCCSLTIFIPLGLAIRKANYINAEGREVHNGGLTFNSSATHGSMILMGDSNGSMYGKSVKEIAEQLDLKLTVVSVAAGDPLPKPMAGVGDALWRDSLWIVKRVRPDVLVLACNWRAKVSGHEGRLKAAIKDLAPFTRSIVLITQPPQLPPNATRQAVRSGSLPPFLENGRERSARTASNNFVKALSGGIVSVVDIENLFASPDGVITTVDHSGRQLFQDNDHLSAAGASLVKSVLVNAIASAQRQ